MDEIEDRPGKSGDPYEPYWEEFEKAYRAEFRKVFEEFCCRKLERLREERAQE